MRPVTTEQIAELAARIGREFDVEQVILFGSRAYGTPHEHSDVDLLVIFSHEDVTNRTSLDILRQVAPEFPVDLIAWGVSKAQSRYRGGDPIVREAFDKGRVLYRKSA